MADILAKEILNVCVYAALNLEQAEIRESMDPQCDITFLVEDTLTSHM